MGCVLRTKIIGTLPARYAHMTADNIASTTAVLLASGQGTRMKSGHPKVLHQILGRPMISYLIQTLKTIGVADILVVVGYQAEKVMAALEG